MIKLWLRLGDNAEYESFDCIEEIKEIFEERELTKDFTRRCRYGVQNSEFKQNNYISLYYGDEEAQPIRKISDGELIFLNS